MTRPSDAGTNLVLRCLVVLLALSTWPETATAQSPYRLEGALGVHPTLFLPPTAIPPARFVHWDLREFPSCKVPYSLNELGHADSDPGNEFIALNTGVGSWEAVTPAIIAFEWTPFFTTTNTFGMDGVNVLTWDNNVVQNLNQWGAAPSGTIAVTCVFTNANFEAQESDIIFNDRDWQWNTSGNHLDNFVRSGVEPFALADGQTLTLKIDGGAVQTITFNTAAFANIAMATDFEVSAAINAQIANGTAVALVGDTVGIRPNSTTFNGGRTVEITGGTANAALNYPLGVIAVRAVDTETIGVHELGHFVGITHTTSAGPPGGAVMTTFAPNTGTKRALTAEDQQALNFLYTPDLGDAPDPWIATFNEYQSKVHSTVPLRMLNGLQLYEPAAGPVHLFGYRGPTPYAGDRFEWLGADMNGSALECESRQVDADTFDDGVVAPNPLIRGAVNRITVTVSHSAQIGRYVGNDDSCLFGACACGTAHGAVGIAYIAAGVNTTLDSTLNNCPGGGDDTIVANQITTGANNVMNSIRVPDDVCLAGGSGCSCNNFFGSINVPFISLGPDSVSQTPLNGCPGQANDLISGTQITTGTDNIEDTQTVVLVMAPPEKQLHFNGYLDFPGDGVFDVADLEIWWSGIPDVPAGPGGVPPASVCTTTQSSGNFVPPAVCTPTTITLNFDVPVPLLTADEFYCRYRLDYGEDEGTVANYSGDLGPAVGAAQFGEVEDDYCSAANTEIDFFPASEAEVDIRVPAGDLTPNIVQLIGPTTVEVDLASLGDTADIDLLEQVPTEILSMQLTGNSLFGPVIVRIRDSALHPFEQTLGEIEETVDNTPGVLDIPPFKDVGTADSFFDVYFEIELPNLGLLLHNHDPKRMEAVITHKPPAEGETYENNDFIQLFTELEVLVAEIGPAFHIPNPIPPPPFCGDGTIDLGEECDDGNMADGDGCSSACEVEDDPCPGSGPQDKDQQKCINALNKDGSKVAAAQGKENQRCLKDAGKGDLVGSVLSCLSADANGKVQKKKDKTVADIVKKCTTLPDFGISSGTTAATVNAAAQGQEIALMTDIFGATPAAILCAGDQEGCKCQQAVLKDYEKLAAAKMKEFVKCKKAVLKGGASDACMLQKCVDDPATVGSIADDGKGKIAKKLAKLVSTIASKCDGAGVDTNSALPGDCTGQLGPALAACIDARVECRVCLTINAMDDLNVDCDLFDDGAANGSCP